jgi:hypothetical protein
MNDNEDNALERALFILTITGSVASLVSLTNSNNARKFIIIGLATLIAAFIPELSEVWKLYRNRSTV